MTKEQYTCSVWIQEWHHFLLITKAQADSLGTKSNFLLLKKKNQKQPKKIHQVAAPIIRKVKLKLQLNPDCFPYNFLFSL